MPGVLGYSWRGGSQSEYLAQYFLSALGVSVPVLRQEDIGIDFECVVTREKIGRKLVLGAPYTVQVGSLGGKDFVYGGFAKRKGKGKEKEWRELSLNWLFSQEVPFFVCTVDRKTSTFRLYSTSPMWHLRNLHASMTEVQLLPEADHDLVNHSREQVWPGDSGNGDGGRYRVPLFKPIVELTMGTLEDKTEAVLWKAREALSFAIEYDQKNITYRRSGVKATYWFPNAVPNDPASLRSVMQGGFAPSPFRELREVMKAAALCAAYDLKGHPDLDVLKCLMPLFELFPIKEIPGWIEAELPDAIKEVIARRKS